MSRRRPTRRQKIDLRTTRPFAFRGGLDLSASPLRVDPGRLLFTKNYEPGPGSEGYRRINGYERFDGRPEVSDASYWILSYDTGTNDVFAEGATVTGDTSGATGTLLVDDVLESGTFAGSDAAGYLVLTDVVGTFVDGENLSVSATVGAVAVEPAYERSATTTALDQTYLQDAYDTRRLTVGTVTGTSDIADGWHYGDDVVVFRGDGANITAYKSSAAGWVAVPFYDYIKYDAGVHTGPPNGFQIGDTVTGASSGASATVAYVGKYSGTWGSDAAGWLILTGVTGGPFTDGENLQVSAVTYATADGANTTYSITDGSNDFHFYNHEFATYGVELMFGCDGVGSGFFYDGVAIGPMYTGMSTDVPINVHVHQSHLWFAFASGVVQHSSINEPFENSVLTGAAAIQLGAEVTNFLSLGDEALAVASRNHIGIVYGTSSADWNNKSLKKHQESVGAIARTMQPIANNVFLDDRGVMTLAVAQEYGNFTSNTLSEPIAALVDAKRHLVTDTVALREKVHYRMFCSDGTVIVIGFDRNEARSFTTLSYDVTFRRVFSFEKSDGTEMTIGIADGKDYVYRMDVGRSFDGAAIEAYFRTVFNHITNPRIKKDFKKVVFDVDVDETASIQYQVAYNYDTPDIPNSVLLSTTTDVIGGGGWWNEGNWNEFLWNGQVISQAEAWVPGQGLNASLLVYSSSAIERPHTFRGIQYIYSPMRVEV